MHNLTYNALLEMLAKVGLTNTYNIFVETGTNRGRTILPMSKYFRRLHTIELDGTFYYKTKQKAVEQNITNINFIHGDSAEKIKDVVDQLTEKAIYFLDSHWCGFHTGFSGKDCPLLEELQYIHDNDKYDSCLIIDDYRLFGQRRQKPEWREQRFIDKFGAPKVEDWSEITDQAVKACLGDRIQDWQAVGDRLIILLKPVVNEQ